MPYHKKKFHKPTPPKPSLVIDIQTGTVCCSSSSRTKAKKFLAHIIRGLPPKKDPSEPDRYTIKDYHGT